MKNKSGFTLVELLAILIVLVIIGVIAVTSVSDILEQTTESSFKSSYDIIHKDVENRIKQIELGLDVDLECDDNSEDINKHCYKIYELSEEDYKMKVAKVNDSYSLCVEGIGKFEELDLDKNKYKAIYTIFGNTSYNKINVKNTEHCDRLDTIEKIKPEDFDSLERFDDYDRIEYVGRKTASYLHDILEEISNDIKELKKARFDECMNALGPYDFADRNSCISKYSDPDHLDSSAAFMKEELNKRIEKESMYGNVVFVEMKEDGRIIINLELLYDASEKIEDCDAAYHYKGCSSIIKGFQHKDLFCYHMGSVKNLFAKIEMKKDENGKYVFVKIDDESCLGRN